MTVPVIDGFVSERYWKVPTCVKVNEKVPPGMSAGLLSGEKVLGVVTVWSIDELFVHFTVVPVFTVRFCGLKAPLAVIETLAIAALEELTELGVVEDEELTELELIEEDDVLLEELLEGCELIEDEEPPPRKRPIAWCTQALSGPPTPRRKSRTHNWMRLCSWSCEPGICADASVAKEPAARTAALPAASARRCLPVLRKEGACIG